MLYHITSYYIVLYSIVLYYILLFHTRTHWHIHTEYPIILYIDVYLLYSLRLEACLAFNFSIFFFLATVGTVHPRPYLEGVLNGWAAIDRPEGESTHVRDEPAPKRRVERPSWRYLWNIFSSAKRGTVSISKPNGFVASPCAEKSIQNESERWAQSLSMGQCKVVRCAQSFATNAGVQVHTA